MPPIVSDPFSLDSDLFSAPHFRPPPPCTTLEIAITLPKQPLDPTLGQGIIDGIIRALPAVLNVFVLSLLVMAIWAIMGTEFFSEAQPQRFGEGVLAGEGCDEGWVGVSCGWIDPTFDIVPLAEWFVRPILRSCFVCCVICTLGV